MVLPYRPEPYVDFSQPEPVAKMREALALVAEQLGRDYPNWIGGREVRTEDQMVSINPGNTEQVIGRFPKVDAKLADEAVRAAAASFEHWSRFPYDARAKILFRVAAIMRRRIYELCAWMVYEVSKSYAEAYAEVAEAIDFAEWYGREMLRIGGSQPTVPFPGEDNELRYIPLGVGVVIPPWNFPLAICSGMTDAAIVTGNTVVLKPASTSPVIAYKYLEILHEAGLPKDVVNFVTGPGGLMGDTLTSHPLTRFIAFTGSAEVGLHINQLAATPNPECKWIKRTILEMGGKDFVAVDDSADLDLASTEAVTSAFGFQGQKCSAGSRLIVHQAVYDALVPMVVEKARKLSVGNPSEGNIIGAVIDKNAYNRIWEYIEVGKGEGKLLLGGEKLDLPGYYIPPTIFGDVPENARIAQEEIFGPVLSIIKARDFDHIIEIANGTNYGLTGALISKNREHLERGRHELHCGNLYLNRKCTGALVGVQPFGGFNMSGTDSKAGGSDYLLLFTQAKSITERF
ncbi:MAG: L-glutamate gamma-semialdehyde dehydrogenase [Fimbriimonadia bacterium]